MSAPRARRTFTAEVRAGGEGGGGLASEHTTTFLPAPAAEDRDADNAGSWPAWVDPAAASRDQSATGFAQVRAPLPSMPSCARVQVAACLSRFYLCRSMFGPIASVLRLYATTHRRPAGPCRRRQPPRLELSTVSTCRCGVAGWTSLSRPSAVALTMLQ